MTYLLDTCVISEAMKKRPDPDVMEWMRHILYPSRGAGRRYAPTLLHLCHESEAITCQREILQSTPKPDQPLVP